jgi:hypothetical protein
MNQASKQEALWRCEFKNSPDKNLIAKFFKAANAQEAMEKAQKWHGSPVTIIVSPGE